MSEREPRSQPEQPAEPQTWEVAPVVDALEAAAEPRRHVAFGAGVQLQLDAETAAALELYPAAGVVRLTTQDAEVTLFRQPPPALDPERGRVRFARDTDTERVRLSLAASGEVALFIAPVAPGRETRAVVDPGDAGIPLAGETRVLGRSGGSSDAAAEPSPTPVRPVQELASGEQASKRERLTLSGRLGRAPSFRTTRNGKLIASFPLAVRDEDGNTTWHTILTFGARAEQLRDQLEKGQVVQVIGYQHAREVRTKRGETKTVVEVYATLVKPR